MLINENYTWDYTGISDNGIIIMTSLPIASNRSGVFRIWITVNNIHWCIFVWMSDLWALQRLQSECNNFAFACTFSHCRFSYISCTRTSCGKMSGVCQSPYGHNVPTGKCQHYLDAYSRYVRLYSVTLFHHRHTGRLTHHARFHYFALPAALIHSTYCTRVESISPVTTSALSTPADLTGMTWCYKSSDKISDRLSLLEWQKSTLPKHIHRVWKKTYNLPWITLTNLSVFLLFLAHIIPMICFTKTCKICY